MNNIAHLKYKNVVLGAGALLFAALTGYIFKRFTINAAIFIEACVIGVIAFAIYARYVFCEAARCGLSIKGSARKTAVATAGASCLGAVLLEAGTIVGTPASTLFTLASWSKTRLVLFFIIAYALIVVILRRVQLHRESKDELNDALVKRAFALRCGMWSLAAIIIVLIVIAAILSGMLRWSYAATTNRIVFLGLCIAIGLFMLWHCRKELVQHVEYAVLIMVLPLGMFLCFALPPTVAVTWDGAIHYDKAFALSYLGTARATEADFKLMSLSPDSTDQLEEIDKEIDDINETYEAAKVSEAIYTDITNFRRPITGGSILGLNTVGILPHAIGLWIGRLLGFSLTSIFICGRLAGLLAYTAIIVYAIRVIPFCKVLLAVIALLPVSMFQAANYSYDPWCAAWIMLGVAQVMKEREQTNEPFTLLAATRCALPLLLGLFVKAIYFPILGVLYLIPKERFTSQRSWHVYLGCVTIVGVLVVSTFILPLLFPAPGSTDGDLRGGADVSTSGQIRYVLEHPIAAFKIIMGYLFTNTFAVYTQQFTRYGYLGYVSFLRVPAVLLLGGTALFDTSDKQKRELSVSVRLWLLFIALLATILSILALYLSFTPVGLDTVNGWQQRYIVPVLLTLLMGIGLPARVNRKLVMGVSLTMIVAINICLDVMRVCTIAWLP